MMILRIAILSYFLYLLKLTYEQLPLFHFIFKLLFYKHFLVMMFEIFCNAVQTEEHLLMVGASFNIAVVDLNYFPPTAAENIVGSCPVIILEDFFRRWHS